MANTGSNGFEVLNISHIHSGMCDLWYKVELAFSLLWYGYSHCTMVHGSSYPAHGIRSLRNGFRSVGIIWRMVLSDFVCGFSSVFTAMGALWVVLTWKKLSTIVISCGICVDKYSLHNSTKRKWRWRTIINMNNRYWVRIQIKTYDIRNSIDSLLCWQPVGTVAAL